MPHSYDGDLPVAGLLDKFLEFYDLKRSHQVYRLKDRTPAQALREAIGRKRLPPIIPIKEADMEKQAA